MELLEKYSLSQLNTFHIEAKSKYFAEVSTTIDTQEASLFAKRNNLPVLILGGGSNILFTKDFEGIIIKPSKTGINIIDENKKQIFLEVSAGEKWDDVVHYAIERNYFGIENLVAIPGNAGAAPIQNIGAYGVELKDSFFSLKGFNIASEKWVELNKDECDFNYRQSIFKSELKDIFIIDSFILQLSKVPNPKLEYANIKEYFNNLKWESLTAQEIAVVIKKIRESKLPNPKILGNAGSFFKNPIISRDKFNQLKLINTDIPNFIAGINEVKIPAGWLIEKCGFKGKRTGNVGTYEKQSLILVNYGNAMGNEILQFAELIKSKVELKFGIQLEYEVNIK